MLAVGAEHLTNCKPVAARIFCSAKWKVDGRWMEGGEGQWNRRGLCSQRIGSRLGSFNFILFCQTAYRFTFPDCYRVKHRSTSISFPLSLLWLRNTVYSQVRSIKVREFLFARKSNPFAFRGNESSKTL